jgi:hypothetical protein
MKIHVPIIFSGEGNASRVRAQTLVKQHRSTLKGDPMVLTLMINKIKRPGFIRLVVNVDDTAHHMGINAISMHVEN